MCGEKPFIVLNCKYLWIVPMLLIHIHKHNSILYCVDFDLRDKIWWNPCNKVKPHTDTNTHTRLIYLNEMKTCINSLWCIHVYRVNRQTWNNMTKIYSSSNNNATVSRRGKSASASISKHVYTQFNCKWWSNFHCPISQSIAVRIFNIENVCNMSVCMCVWSSNTVNRKFILY